MYTPPSDVHTLLQIAVEQLTDETLEMSMFNSCLSATGTSLKLTTSSEGHPPETEAGEGAVFLVFFKTSSAFKQGYLPVGASKGSKK